jgi:hypothetical protein
MSNHFNSIIIITICLFSANLKAQDKILFLNGKTMEGSLLEKTNYEFTFKNKKDKQFLIDKYRVFSYTQNNKEHVVYEFDTLSGNFLKAKDMKMFVYGEKEAYQTYKPNLTNALGLILGATAGYFMHKENAFIYIATPLIYTPITLAFPTKVNQKKITEIKYLKEDEYLRGYERVARSKRTQGALKSSIFGVVTGYLISVIVSNIKN